jgi:hypothetical protein
MDEQTFLAERFEEHRGRLRAVAYRMLGSLSVADDAVRDTVMHGVFAVPFEDIAPVIERTPEATRQLASRPAPRPSRQRDT